MATEDPRKALALQVLQVLDAQQDYFTARRKDVDTNTLLIKSKELERQLRKTCQDIVTAPPPNLFDAPPAA